MPATGESALGKLSVAVPADVGLQVTVCCRVKFAQTQPETFWVFDLLDARDLVSLQQCRKQTSVRLPGGSLSMSHRQSLTGLAAEACCFFVFVL